MNILKEKTKNNLNNEAVIFDFQKYSIHDGPGIRTIVFIKGCPLSCIWCSNPESQDMKPQVVFFEKNCIDCGKCISICPRSALKKVSELKIIDRELCDSCGKCADGCPANAMRKWGKEYTVEEVLSEVIKDQPFYRRSGGGVTLSGGEPLTVPDFSLKLLKKLKENFINTTIETSGFGRWEDLKNLMEYTDIVLYDIKHVNPKKHKELTGVDNKLILENLKKAVESGISKIILRVPLVPGFNDAEENIKGIFELASSYKIAKINFLPYHRLGEAKYDRLGMNYKLNGLKPSPDSYYLEKINKIEAQYPEIEVELGG